MRALLLVRVHPPARCARVPLRFAKGGQSAWFMFLWIPASAGMTGVRALPPSVCIPLLAALASPFALRRGVFVR